MTKNRTLPATSHPRSTVTRNLEPYPRCQRTIIVLDHVLATFQKRESLGRMQAVNVATIKTSSPGERVVLRSMVPCSSFPRIPSIPRFVPSSFPLLPLCLFPLPRRHARYDPGTLAGTAKFAKNTGKTGLGTLARLISPSPGGRESATLPPPHSRFSHHPAAAPWSSLTALYPRLE
jgi:hypothetical protein